MQFIKCFSILMLLVGTWSFASAKNPLTKTGRQKRSPQSSDKDILLEHFSSEELKARIHTHLKPLFNLCDLKGKTIQQKTTLFMERLKNLSSYTVDIKETAFTLSLEDRLMLNAIRSQIDTALADLKAFKEQGHTISPNAIRALFEQVYLSHYNVADNVPISAVAPWWLKQILDATSCINKNPKKNQPKPAKKSS